jgi:hypothetical protein
MVGRVSEPRADRRTSAASINSTAQLEQTAIMLRHMTVEQVNVSVEGEE